MLYLKPSWVAFDRNRSIDCPRLGLTNIAKESLSIASFKVDKRCEWYCSKNRQSSARISSYFPIYLVSPQRSSLT